MEDNKWLDEDVLHKLAIELLFQNRLQKRLEYLYNEHSNTNGLEMFDVMAKYLSDLMFQIDMQLVKNRSYDESLERHLDLNEKRFFVELPIHMYLPKYKGKGKFITQYRIEKLRDKIRNFTYEKNNFESENVVDSQQPEEKTQSWEDKNNFNGVPLDLVKKHFMRLVSKNKSDKYFLTEKDLCTFIQRAFINLEEPLEEEKLSINYSYGEKMLICALFYDFFKEYTPNKYTEAGNRKMKGDYVRLLSNHFKGSEFTYEKVHGNFKPTLKSSKLKW